MLYATHCVALSRGSTRTAAAIAEQYQDARLADVLKAAQGAGSMADTDWAQPIASYQQMAREFIDASRPTSVLLNLSNARRIPFRTTVARVGTSATAGWVAEGVPKPLSEMSLGSASLDALKAAVIVVITEELARMSSPSADALIRAELIAAINALVDATLVSTTAAATGRPGLARAESASMMRDFYRGDGSGALDCACARPATKSAKGATLPNELACSSAFYSVRCSTGITVHTYPAETSMRFIKHRPMRPFPLPSMAQISIRDATAAPLTSTYGTDSHTLFR